MVEWASVIAAGLIGAAIVLLATYLRDRRSPARLTFEDVCEAAARAKLTRKDEAPGDEVPRDFRDGVDAVLAKLMKQGYGDTPDEMRAAYLAGGEEVELEVERDDLTRQPGGGSR